MLRILIQTEDRIPPCINKIFKKFEKISAILSK